MPSTKEIRRRIKGVKGTGKITRAMEMISAVKMRRAVAGVSAIRPYAESAFRVLRQASLAARAEEHPVFRERPTRSVLIAVITSNRGLCGSFNAQVMRQAKAVLEKLRDHEPAVGRIDFLSIGKKGDQMLRRFEKDIVASFPDIVAAPSVEAVRPAARFILDAYGNGTYDKIMLVYTDYVSALVQKTRARRLFPISYGAMEDEIVEMEVLGEPVSVREARLDGEHHVVSGPALEYTIEPNPETVLKELVPRLLEMQLYHAVLESNASQEAARMTAMRNASDAAQEMADDLTLAYNQLRQAKVTQEIAELSAGMAAVG
jgi:F-type H+-transporting ATPase subunit gamma